MAQDKNTHVTRFLLIGLAIVILIILVMQYNMHANKTPAAASRSSTVSSAPEKYTEPSPLAPLLQQPSRPSPSPAPMVQMNKDLESKLAEPAVVNPSEPLSNEDYKAIDFSTETKFPSDCFPKDRLTADDLLPKDAANSKWAQVNPAGQGDVKDQNFLTAGMHMGVNTVGQSLRNPNLQIRSEPPNPRYNVGPWNQTTIDYDQARRHFEIGQC